jgi:hypothetical protein
LLGISEPAWQALLVGGVVALWFLVVLTGTARADDCLEYVKNARNFVTIPKGLLEDCMRTGTVQALVTGAVAGIGGATIAAAVSKAIQDAAAQAGPGPHIVPDGVDQGATVEPGSPGDVPEGPPAQQTRDKTPEPCRGSYDEYLEAVRAVQVQGSAVQTIRHRYEVAFRNHQNNLAKLTIQLGMDAADLASAGVGGIKGGMGIARAVARSPEVLAELITNAVRRSGHLATQISGLIQDIADLMGKASRAVSAADEAGRLSAKAEARVVELVREAAALESKAANFEDLLRFARSADATLLERNALAGRVLEAEQAMRREQQIWQRRQQLQVWAEGERISITAEQARLSLQAKAELDGVTEEIQALQARIAQSPEVTNAAVRTSKATTSLHALEARIRELEARAQQLSARLQTIRTLSEKKQAFLRAEDALDAASQALDASDAKRLRLRDELKELGTSPSIPGLREKQHDALLEFNRADAEYKEAAARFKNAEYDLNDIDKELDDIAARGEADGPTPAQVARREEARRAMGEANQAMEDARNFKTIRETEWTNARTAVTDEEERIRALHAPEVERVKAQIASAEEASAAATVRKDLAQLQYDAAAKELQPYSHPGVDPNAGPAVEAELRSVRDEQLPTARSELPAARREFDAAYDAEAEVKAQLEAQSRPGLEARRVEAEARLKQAERGWQEVAAERDPGNYQQWKREVEGTDPGNEASNQLRPFEEKVSELRKQEEALEKKLNDARDRTGGRSSESIESELRSVREQQSTRTDELTAGRKEVATQKAAAGQAEAAARTAQGAVTAAEATKKQLEEEKRKVDEEKRQLEHERDHPSPPRDVYDAVSQKSRAARQALDDTLDAITPDSLTAPFRWAGAKAGEAFHKAFGGQSPEEVARIIKEGDALVKQRAKWLDDAQREYDTRLQHARAMKDALNRCIALNR